MNNKIYIPIVTEETYSTLSNNQYLDSLPEGFVLMKGAKHLIVHNLGGYSSYFYNVIERYLNSFYIDLGIKESKSKAAQLAEKLLLKWKITNSSTRGALSRNLPSMCEYREYRRDTTPPTGESM